MSSWLTIEFFTRAKVTIRNLDCFRHPTSSVGKYDHIQVQLRDGIRIRTETLGTVVCDANSPTGDVVVVSHAHTDHLPRSKPQSPVICSELTADLAVARRSFDTLPVTNHPAITLIPAGHVAGSRAALITDRNCRILFTGDVTTRNRPGLEGFKPVSADILILEATYGKLMYEFPPVEDVTESVIDWIAQEPDRPVIFGGYALGRAQRLIRMLGPHLDDPIKTTKGVRALNQIITHHTGKSFPTTEFSPDTGFERGDVVLLPAGTRTTKQMKRLIERENPRTASFTGWAADSSFQYRGSVDQGFIFSDHCDFSELIALVSAVDPEIVYTHHGFSKSLAEELTRRGYHAQALDRHHRPLDTF